MPVATGDKKGLGQMRVLHFESVQPIKTSCGAFKVEVRLSGEQPITRMRIVRENADGGRFYAPIAVNGKLVFTPAGRSAGEILEITRNVRFPANQGIEWAGEFGKNGIQRSGFVLVDTDNDRVPDTYLPGTSSNFAAGLPSGRQTKIISPCHTVDDEGHCPVATID